jgi:uncharacterized protein YutE (UPF0331/DUF86 family)
MVKADSIAKRLLNAEKSLHILSSLQKYGYDDFLSDPLVYGSSERFLQLAIEALMDIGSHIIADLQLGVINWSCDIPALLFEQGYLDERQKAVFIRMIGFRNTLVHEYIEIDRAIVFDVLHNHLDDIKDLMKVYAGFI